MEIFLIVLAAWSIFALIVSLILGKILKWGRGGGKT